MPHTKRMLIIERLVVGIPDDWSPETGTRVPEDQSAVELSIDDCLRFILRQRESERAKANNQFGNFTYTFSDLPRADGINPTALDSLLGYIFKYPERAVVGRMMVLHYDPELDAHRYVYLPEEAEKLEKEKEWIRRNKAMKDAEEAIRKALEVDEAGLQAAAGEVTAEHAEPKQEPHVPPCDDCSFDICDENCPHDATSNKNGDVKPSED